MFHTTQGFDRVPKEYLNNLAFRLEVRQRGAEDIIFRQKIIQACREDVLFFFNTFIYLYEPRLREDDDGHPLPMCLPFITWPHQEPVIVEIRENLGKSDCLVEKSRGEGASWIAVLLALHDWLFRPMSNIGFVSRSMEAADDPEDMDSLMAKLDWELTMLPRWMVPEFKRLITSHTLRNVDNGSLISAYTATGDVTSGGRKLWMLMDELAKFGRNTGEDYEAMASTQHVTDSRLVVSTPKGSSGAYFDAVHTRSGVLIGPLILDWKANIYRNRGLYKLVEGVPVAIDESNPLRKGYAPLTEETNDLFARLRNKGFRLQGTIRAPWYDRECDRVGATPQNIAQELDRDYGGSQARIFNEEFRTAINGSLKPAYHTGEVTYHSETLKPTWETSKTGQAKLWCSLDEKGRPPRHNYVAGADIATGQGGTYSSNSVLEVFDQNLMEQVFEFASNTIEPSDFADLSVAICLFFNNAHLSWEKNGPGEGYTSRLIDQRPLIAGRVSLFRRKIKQRRTTKITDEYGWWTDPKTKRLLFEHLNVMIKTGQITIRSRELAQETDQYVSVRGKIEHIQAVTTEDDSSMGQNHGDRVMATGVALQAMKDRPLFPGSGVPTEHDKTIDPSTLAGRDAAYRESNRENNDGWDDRTSHDLAQGRAHPNTGGPWDHF